MSHEQFDQAKIDRSEEKFNIVKNKVSHAEAIAQGLCRDCQVDPCVTSSGRCQERRDAYYFDKIRMDTQYE